MLSVPSLPWQIIVSNNMIMSLFRIVRGGSQGGGVVVYILMVGLYWKQRQSRRRCSGLDLYGGPLLQVDQ